MAQDRSDSLRSLLNASGFAFQLAVEEAVRTTKDHHWEFLSREHPWLSSETGLEGFIDLVLEGGMLRMVIECKRVRDADWVFLVTSDRATERRRTRCLWADGGQVRESVSGWFDFRTDPRSLESEFCSVRGAGENDAPMLERVGSALVRALDALAGQELGLKNVPAHYFPRIYMPVIVTTARLTACVCDPGQVSLNDGQLTGGAFHDVPWIRFCKSLAASAAVQDDADSLVSFRRESERTVTIVSAEHFPKFLQEFDLGVTSGARPWPWETARAAAAERKPAG